MIHFMCQCALTGGDPQGLLTADFSIFIQIHSGEMCIMDTALTGEIAME